MAGRKRRRAAVYPWDRIREEYVTAPTDITYAAIAARYGCHINTVQQRARREGWPEQRAHYREQAARRTRQQIGLIETEFRAREYRRGLLMVLKGVKRIEQIDPRNLSVKQAVKLIEAGHRLMMDSLALQGAEEGGELHVVLEWRKMKGSNDA